MGVRIGGVWHEEIADPGTGGSDSGNGRNYSNPAEYKAAVGSTKMGNVNTTIGGGGGGGSDQQQQQGSGSSSSSSLDAQFQKMLAALASGNKEAFDFEKEKFNRQFEESKRQFDLGRSDDLSKFEKNFGLSEGALTGTYQGKQTESGRQFDVTSGENKRQFDVNTQQHAVDRYGNLGSTLLNAATQLRGPRDYLQYQQMTRGGQNLLQQLQGNQPIPQFGAPTGQLESANLQNSLQDLGFDPSQIDPRLAGLVRDQSPYANPSRAGVPQGGSVPQGYALGGDITPTPAGLTFQDGGTPYQMPQRPPMNSPAGPGGPPSTGGGFGGPYVQPPGGLSIQDTGIYGAPPMRESGAPPAAPQLSDGRGYYGPATRQVPGLSFGGTTPNPQQGYYGPATPQVPGLSIQDNGIYGAPPQRGAMPPPDPRQQILQRFGLQAGQQQGQPQRLLPNQIDPARWDAMGQIGRDLTKNLAETAYGYDANDFERQINATRPMGQAPRRTAMNYAKPTGLM